MDDIKAIKTLSDSDKINILAERCRQSFFAFFQMFWEESGTEGHDCVYNWHIAYLCQEFEAVYQQVVSRTPKKYDIIINISPGTTKSTIATRMFPAWVWTKAPWLSFICGSHAWPLSLELSGDCRELVRSTKYKSLFPYLKIKKDKDTKSIFQIQFTRTGGKGRWRNGGYRYATSVGSNPIGMHGDFHIIDDPLDPESSLSQTDVDMANRWLTQTLSTRKTDKLVTPLVLVMQRLGIEDPSEHIKQKKGIENIRHICLPGEYTEDIKPKALKKFYQNKERVFDPIRMPRTVLMAMRQELGEFGYAGQILQRPIPKGGALFHPENIKSVQDVSELEPMATRVITVRYWDKAGTETTNKNAQAYSVGIKMSYWSAKTGKRAFFCIEDVQRGQWPVDRREENIDSTAHLDGGDVLIYTEQEPGSGGKESAESTVKRLVSKGFRAYKDIPTGDKVKRADPFAVAVNQGLVYMIDSSWNKDFVYEMKYFPNIKIKDQIDACSGAFGVVSKKARSAGTWGRRARGDSKRNYVGPKIKAA